MPTMPDTMRPNRLAIVRNGVRNSHIIKGMKVEGKILVKGDWIVVEGVEWEEDGMVVDWDDEEINMFDGKEGWTVKRDEIKKIYFKFVSNDPNAL